MIDSIHLPSVASEPVRNRWPGFEESFYYDLIGPLLDTSGPSIGTASSASKGKNNCLFFVCFFVEQNSLQ